MPTVSNEPCCPYPPSDHRMRLLQRAKAKDLMELERRWDITAPPVWSLSSMSSRPWFRRFRSSWTGSLTWLSAGAHSGCTSSSRPNVRPASSRTTCGPTPPSGWRCGWLMRRLSDVLGVPDAAFFDPDLPGRAVSKTGASRLAPFQTAYAEDRPDPGPTAPDITIEEACLRSRGAVGDPEGLLPPVPETDGPTDIARVVATVQQAAAAAELPAPRRPWLDDLQPSYNVIDIVKNQTLGDRLVFGVVDAPLRAATVSGVV